MRSRAVDFGIKPPLFDKRDIHVHVPEGATPKDGPSAGVAMVTAIVSVLTGIPVRKDVAMTGEVTLRGRVLPIGGLKEKLLAALRGGIKTVLIPEENAKDLAEIPDNVKKGLKIIPVSHGRRGARAGAGAQARADRMGRSRHEAPAAAPARPTARRRRRTAGATEADCCERRLAFCARPSGRWRAMPLWSRRSRRQMRQKIADNRREFGAVARLTRAKSRRLDARRSRRPESSAVGQFRQRKGGLP